MSFCLDPRRVAFVFVPLLLVPAVVRCGAVEPADTSTGPGFQLGAYDNCATTTFLKVPGGGGQLGLVGSVSLTQSGSELTVSYGADSGVLDASLKFDQTSAISAALHPGQQMAGIAVPCAPLENAPSVAVLQSGSLTFNAGTLFLSVEGADLGFDAGNGCSNPGGTASVVITCRDHAGTPAAAPAPSNAAALASDFVGTYTCASSEINSKLGDAGGYESVSSTSPWMATGKLTVTESVGVLTAVYADDMFVAGTMQFVPTTRNAAGPASTNGAMQVYCYDPVGGSPNAPLETLPVTSSTLTIDGSSVVLSFAGTMAAGGQCVGAETFVSLLCAK
jgi:hypothetical protein